MTRVRDEAVDYAVKEADKLRSGYFGKLDWEQTLFENSKPFFNFLLSRSYFAFAKLSKKLKELKADDEPPALPRELITLIYGAIYFHLGSHLPLISRERAIKLWGFYFAMNHGEVEDKFLEILSKANRVWCGMVHESLEEHETNSTTRVTACILGMILLHEVSAQLRLTGNAEKDKDDENESGSEDEGATVPDKVDSEGKFAIVPYNKGKSDDESITFDSIGGQAQAKAKMMRLVTALNSPERYKKWGTRPPRGVCIYGPPGTGKTLLARAVANEANVSFYYIDGTDLNSKWIGTAAKRVKSVFRQARKSGGVIFIDEADALAPSRGGRLISIVDVEVVTALNTCMDGFKPNDRVVVIFATNRIGDLDEAVLRAGRIDLKIEVPLPDESGRMEIFKVHINKARTISGRELFDLELDLEAVAKAATGHSGADIAEIVRRVLEGKIIEEDCGYTPAEVTTGDFLLAIEDYEAVKEKGKRKIGFKI